MEERNISDERGGGAGDGDGDGEDMVVVEWWKAKVFSWGRTKDGGGERRDCGD